MDPLTNDADVSSVERNNDPPFVSILPTTSCFRVAGIEITVCNEDSFELHCYGCQIWDNLHYRQVVGNSIVIIPSRPKL
jgi:hypothetical protein